MRTNITHSLVNNVALPVQKLPCDRIVSFLSKNSNNKNITYYMPGTDMNTLYDFSHLIITHQGCVFIILFRVLLSLGGAAEQGLWMNIWGAPLGYRALLKIF